MKDGMVDQDKNIYFLHIAGTGGRALKEYILNPLLNKDVEIIGKHDGCSDCIDDKTYIICILRDPVKHACGFYLHFIYKDSDGPNIRQKFLEYFRGTKQLHNFQSQNLMVSGQNFNYGEGKHFGDEIVEIDEDLLLKRIDRIDLLISQDMLRYNMQDVANILAEDLDLNFIKIENINQYKHSNGMSRDLYNSLTEAEKQEIIDLNNIDYKIYSQLKNKELKTGESKN